MGDPWFVIGRGAWTKLGHDHGQAFYQHASGAKADGARPDLDMHHLGVHFGVRAIQALAISQHCATYTEPTGTYGPRTADSVAELQRKNGAGVDGKFGRQTAKAVFPHLVDAHARYIGVPVADVWGMTMLESVLDPGAISSRWDLAKGPDWGLCQINQGSHPTGPIAFDPWFALRTTCSRLKAARARFDDKGPDLQRDCSIAQHNSPVRAQQWYEIGWVGEDEQIAMYVANVKKQADTWPVPEDHQ